jgi:hypothetical protein
MPEMVTVYRSAEAGKRQEAADIQAMLQGENLDAEIFDDNAPGVPEGAIEVRVPEGQEGRAEEIIAANPLPPLNESHDLDLVTVFNQPAGASQESEAMIIKGLLESNGIYAVITEGAMLPNTSAQVRVAKDQEQEARRILAEAQASGAQAAEEASGAATEE